MSKAFQKLGKKFDKRFQERERLVTPFVKRFGNPVLVHAVKYAPVFNSILRDGALRIPSEHGNQVKCPYLAKLLKFDDSVFLSLGFVYATSYDFPYNLVFDLKYLKELQYRDGGAYLCYRAVVDYWYEHDREYLEKLAKQSAECKAVVERYLYESYKGELRKLFDFWRIEETVFKFIMQHPKQKTLLNMIRKLDKTFLISYPASMRHAKKIYLTEKTPEILSANSIDLINNPYFIGFYIPDKIPKRTLALLKKKFPERYLFDGKRLRKIAHLSTE